jgi:hypothetical protein
MLIPKNNTSEEKTLADHQFYHGHDCVIRNANQTFITEAVFIDSLETEAIPKNDQLRRKANSDRPIILIVDGHATHVTPRVLASVGFQRISIIQLVTHSSNISRPLDLRVIAVFKMLYKREAKTKRMNGETLKLYRTLLVSCTSTIVPIARRSFVRVGIRLKPKDLLALLTVIPGTVLDRIRMPEKPLEESVFSERTEAAQPAARTERRRAQFQDPMNSRSV